MKTIYTFLLVACFSLSGFAQEVLNEAPLPPPFVKINISFQTAIPLEKFQETLDDVAFGVGIDVLSKLGQMPIWVGAQTGFLMYDKESQKFLTDVGGIDREYEWKTRNNIWLLHGMFRIQPTIDFPVKPYFNAMAGFKRFFTTTNLLDADVEDESLERFVDHSDWVFSFGGTIGVEIPLTKDKEAVLDIRCSYYQGNHAEFYTRNQDAVVIEDTLDVFELKNSPTPLLVPQIGVTFNLSD
ncbi:MAG: hypothetical protein NXI23_12255 [Bacteroidetes bacterium]|jgi:hypothetical protein|nr:hypothetical protein [Bacteroidota bacterium]MDF1864810.1 hypothetical protein [Saprospiraceae bacterium]